MSIDVDARREVRHHIHLILTGDDRWDETTEAWGHQRGKRFQVDTVRWPSRYAFNDDSDPITDTTKVTVGGAIYRSDGSVGARAGARTMLVADLPGPIQQALLEAHGVVYKP